jgi:Flp pilus assembly pilin Flp
MTNTPATQPASLCDRRRHMQRGAGAVEYALILLLIVLAVFIAVQDAGKATNEALSRVNEWIEWATTDAPPLPTPPPGVTPTPVDCSPRGNGRPPRCPPSWMK